MWPTSRPEPAPKLEDVRKKAQILVVDDMAFPYEPLFRRDGYHVQRWAKIENLSQLTDSHFDLILLDLHGVGLDESLGRQGLGILEHIKRTNPAQVVVAYSAQPWAVSNRNLLMLADDVLDKDMEYIEFKGVVDNLLLRRMSRGYFIAKMNAELGDNAELVPKAVPKAIKALKNGNTEGLRRYLADRLPDLQQVQRIATIIGIGAKVVQVGRVVL